MKLMKSTANPILSPLKENSWEAASTCNPGAWYENGTFYLLYRAAGFDDEHKINFGLAASKDGVVFKRLSADPIFGPSADGPDAGCIEDARIVKFNQDYYLTYAFRALPPGKYWEKNPSEVVAYDLTDIDPQAPLCISKNLTCSGLAMTRDFHNFRRLGRITPANVDDRDVILFPEKVDDKYVMLHRPMQWVGEKYGTAHPAIWISYSDDLLTWSDSQLLATGGSTPWEEKIGGAAPPIKTPQGWLTLYHSAGKDKLYRVGVMLLDLHNPSQVVARAKDFIMEPEHYYEFEGFYNGVVFPTGSVVVGDKLYVYYGGADKYCCLAICSLSELLAFVLRYQEPVSAVFL